MIESAARTNLEEAALAVRHTSGLHARPAALFVRAASRFSSEIQVENLTRRTHPVDAKSILSLLTLGVEKDHQIRITADGDDAAEAIGALQRFIEADLAHDGEQPA
ncbi:MAG: HPr family phosphocarrier protein [Anaerolineae bacterium]